MRRRRPSIRLRPMRKDNVLRISIDDYYAEILLTKLPELPRKNIRKIFTLLHDPRNLFLR